MSLTASEQATLNFYEWEYRGRGYYHFDSQVEIEPLYTPFQFKSYVDTPQIDDGKVPSIFGLIGSLFETKPKEAKKEETTTLLPNPVGSFQKLTGFSVSFNRDEEISSLVSAEYLNMLSFSDSAISFEIIGTFDSIKVQFVCSTVDTKRVKNHLKAYFPNAVINEINVNGLGFDFNNQVAIADFGLSDEFMRPIQTKPSFGIDPLTSVIATLDNLRENDTVLLQIIFKGVTAPWVRDIPYAVSDGHGGSFFSNAPEMVGCAKDKISSPLFSCVLRVATQGTSDERSQYLATEIVRSITSISTSQYNKLIPLSNEGYDYDDHLYNVYHRTTNRLGMILNSGELVLFVHYPNKTVISSKLGLQDGKTKKQETIQSDGIYLGANTHQGQEFPVNLDTESRLSHTHIIGATGVGKSTLIANMMLADIEQRRGCAIFDPHGDICDDILKRIPEHRISDVIVINPSDSEYPIGFNLLEAHTEAEKIVLSSDLVSAFKRHATAWGDNMTAVLQNAVNTILDSARGGTLIELKRFLIEESFRNEYLTSVDDPSLHYYWQHEYPMVRKGIAPLLTRIDTFLRPKLVRYMLAQKSGVDISECLRENKIVLLKLSQGLIGEQNSYLLGSLFLAKFNQAALARQAESRETRLPYMLYLDEFQNFITPSIERILSGARKYALGITIAHQELGQIQDNSLLNSILSNPKIRICFRLGDNDAKRLESGFSYFEQSDLQNLGRGQAIMRIGSSNNDFNLQTIPLANTEFDYSENIITNVRNRYGTPRGEVEKLLIDLLPKHTSSKKKTTQDKKEEKADDVSASNAGVSEKSIEASVKPVPATDTNDSSAKEAYIKQAKEEEVIRKHRSLQYFARTLGTQRGLKATLEKEAINDGRIDVVLENDTVKIAIEVSVTNTPDYELSNIQKCIDTGYTYIIMLSEDAKHLEKIKEKAKDITNSTIYFIHPNQLADTLDDIIPKKTQSQKRVRGYRVKTNYNVDGDTNKQKSITDIIMQSLRKKKK